MFNEQGCRNPGPAAIAPHHFGRGLCNSAQVHDIGAIISRRRLALKIEPAAVSEVAQTDIIAALFRRHFFRFVPVLYCR
jgi:hypothetical protein